MHNTITAFSYGGFKPWADIVPCDLKPGAHTSPETHAAKACVIAREYAHSVFGRMRMRVSVWSTSLKLQMVPNRGVGLVGLCGKLSDATAPAQISSSTIPTGDTLDSRANKFKGAGNGVVYRDPPPREVQDLFLLVSVLPPSPQQRLHGHPLTRPSALLAAFLKVARDLSNQGLTFKNVAPSDYKIPDRRGLSVTWVNDEAAKRSKPFLGRTTHQDSFLDPKAAGNFKVRDTQSECTPDDVRGSSRKKRTPPGHVCLAELAKPLCALPPPLR